MLPYISNQQVRELNCSASQALAWVKEAFRGKSQSILPPKTSIAWGDHFLNTMPTSIPSLGIMGCKLVTRFWGRTPTIDGHIILYDQQTGKLKLIVEAAEITALRTGAVCALAVQTFACSDAKTIAMVGLGQTARASLFCLREALGCKRHLNIKLLRYKNQHDLFIKEYESMQNISFEIVDDYQSLVRDSDVVISCITHADKLLAEPEWFKRGCLLVPVHTRGFQNCDAVFDKVFADDIGHIKHFQNFDKFRYLGEIGDVLRGACLGRTSDKERIISYNIGIALHDIVFSYHLGCLMGYS